MLLSLSVAYNGWHIWQVGCYVTIGYCDITSTLLCGDVSVVIGT